MSETDAVAELARQQAALAACLAGAGAVPQGFDAVRVGMAGGMLRAKRMRSAGRAWPAMVECVGEAFERLFGEYARAHGMPEGMTPGEDAARFARFLLETGRLPAAGLRMLCVASARRGVPLKWIWCEGIVVVAVRIRWAGVRVLTLRSSHGGGKRGSQASGLNGVHRAGS